MDQDLCTTSKELHEPQAWRTLLVKLGEIIIIIRLDWIPVVCDWAYN